MLLLVVIISTGSCACTAIAKIAKIRENKRCLMCIRFGVCFYCLDKNSINQFFTKSKVLLNIYFRTELNKFQLYGLLYASNCITLSSKLNLLWLLDIL